MHKLNLCVKLILQYLRSAVSLDVTLIMIPLRIKWHCLHLHPILKWGWNELSVYHEATGRLLNQSWCVSKHFHPCDMILPLIHSLIAKTFYYALKIPVLKANAFTSLLPGLSSYLTNLVPQPSKDHTNCAAKIVSKYDTWTSQWLSLHIINNFAASGHRKINDFLAWNWKLHIGTEGSSTCLLLYVWRQILHHP